MEYNRTFMLIVIISFSLGIIFAILNNDLLIIEDLNNKDINPNTKGKNKRNNIIPIAINIDDSYYLQAIVFITSLLENIGPTTKYEVYIMIPNNFDNNSRGCIDSLINKYGKEKLQIQYFNMKNSFKSAVISESISTSAYYRLLLPSLLPFIDKIIYCDCDMINFEDLSNLYNIELKDNIFFKGILDYYSHRNELFEFHIYTDIYINSGILLINLKSLRENEIEKEFIEFSEIHYLKHHDQTVINAVCSKNIEKIPIKYGIFNFESYNDLVKYNEEQIKNYRYNENELKEAYYNPVMLHYAGFNKPWNHRDPKYEEYWWYYAKKCDFYEQILMFYEYTYKEIDNKIKKIPKSGGFIKNIEKEL